MVQPAPTTAQPSAQHIEQHVARYAAQRLAMRLALLLLRGYKLIISPVLPAACRFYPTCSDYAMQAIEAHGVLRGSWLAAKRIARCHPWHPGGYDPVPPPPASQHTHEQHEQHIHQHVHQHDDRS